MIAGIKIKSHVMIAKSKGHKDCANSMEEEDNKEGMRRLHKSLLYKLCVFGRDPIILIIWSPPEK